MPLRNGGTVTRGVTNQNHSPQESARNYSKCFQCSDNSLTHAFSFPNHVGRGGSKCLGNGRNNIERRVAEFAFKRSDVCGVKICFFSKQFLRKPFRNPSFFENDSKIL